MTASDSPLVTIPARKGKAARVSAGQLIKVINTHGQQIVDTWAFDTECSERMSMEHTRPALGRIKPRAGDTLVTNKRRPILTMVEDNSPGIHDTLVASCDRQRYEQMGCTEYHDNCTDNLAEALEELGFTGIPTPSPWNLFQNTPFQPDGTITFEPPGGKPGDYVLLRAEMDCIIAFSTCPQDLLPVNGPDCTPTEAHFQIL